MEEKLEKIFSVQWADKKQSVTIDYYVGPLKQCKSKIACNNLTWLYWKFSDEADLELTDTACISCELQSNKEFLKKSEIEKFTTEIQLYLKKYPEKGLEI